MERTRFSEERIIDVLKEAEARAKTGERVTVPEGLVEKFSRDHIAALTGADRPIEGTTSWKIKKRSSH